MATQTSTFNLAFSHLSEPLVASLGGDPKPPNVVKALAQWDQAVDVCLATAPWLCALESPTLDRDEAAGDWRYPHRFTLPAGTLRVFNVEGGDHFAWQAGTVLDEAGAVRRIIRTSHAGPLYLDLVVRRPIEALTPLLADALAWELAARLAGPIQSSEAKSEWAFKQAEKAYQRAASAEATEIGGQEVLLPSAMALARRAAG